VFYGRLSALCLLIGSAIYGALGSVIGIAPLVVCVNTYGFSICSMVYGLWSVQYGYGYIVLLALVLSLQLLSLSSYLLSLISWLLSLSSSSYRMLYGSDSLLTSAPLLPEVCL
jgi:hypothetical protein